METIHKHRHVHNCHNPFESLKLNPESDDVEVKPA